MAAQLQPIQDNDLKSSWVKTSKFIFYLQGLCLIAFIVGGCYSLYTFRYKTQPKIEVPGSTRIDNPIYK